MHVLNTWPRLSSHSFLQENLRVSSNYWRVGKNIWWIANFSSRSYIFNHDCWRSGSSNHNSTVVGFDKKLLYTTTTQPPYSVTHDGSYISNAITRQKKNINTKHCYFSWLRLRKVALRLWKWNKSFHLRICSERLYQAWQTDFLRSGARVKWYIMKCMFVLRLTCKNVQFQLLTNWKTHWASQEMESTQ